MDTGRHSLQNGGTTMSRGTRFEPGPARLTAQQLVRTARELVQRGILSTSLHGNISARVPATGQILLTARSSLDRVTLRDLALLDLDGQLIEGFLDPATHEIVEMHTAVYRQRSDVGAIIHTHSPHATAFALAGRPIEPCYEAALRMGVTTPVPVAAYAPRGSEAAVSNILAESGKGVWAVLLANHGLLAFGRDLGHALRVVIAVEEAAQMALLAEAIGGARPIPPELIGQGQARAAAFARTGTVAPAAPSPRVE